MLENKGILHYVDAARILKNKYNEKVDVWSLGILVYQLLSGNTPFDGKNMMEI